MSRAEPIADVCIVGVGGLGGIMAKELASAGLKVVGLSAARRRSERITRRAIRSAISCAPTSSIGCAMSRRRRE